jgi:hypothetical protein
MFATSLIAVDLASLQAMFSGGADLSAPELVLGWGSLAMANALAVAIHQLVFTERGRRSTFLIGFTASGLLAFLAHEVCWAFFRHPMRQGLSRLVMVLVRPWDPTRPFHVVLVFFLLSTAVLILPQLALALGGGLILRRVTDPQARGVGSPAAWSISAIWRNGKRGRRFLADRTVLMLILLAVAGMAMIPRWSACSREVEEETRQQRARGRDLAAAKTPAARSSYQRLIEDAGRRKQYYSLAMILPWLPLPPKPQVTVAE